MLDSSLEFRVKHEFPTPPLRLLSPILQKKPCKFKKNPCAVIEGSGLTLRTFFSGLIDDVRIYNRVVKP